jgi:hypothetical protein
VQGSRNRTVADDAAAVRTSFARAHCPVVLVGHSYGGTVITAAGTDERVALVRPELPFKIDPLKGGRARKRSSAEGGTRTERFLKHSANAAVRPKRSSNIETLSARHYAKEASPRRYGSILFDLKYCTFRKVC